MDAGDQPAPASISPDIVGHYASGYERDRLFQGRRRRERERTQGVLRRHLPPLPATLLDVGGGPGAYAFWLAALGYAVHLVDAVPLPVEQAREEARRRPEAAPASVAVGDARLLNWPDDSADADLLFGPLYHLTEREDRLAALREARRTGLRHRHQPVRVPPGRIHLVALRRSVVRPDRRTRPADRPAP
jgi:SAM-dependent methyltransferase